LRETLLDAARRQLEDRPWGEVTMAAVAAAAGVSRQTLYNEFGSRDALAQALVLREADSFLTAVERAIDHHHDDPVAAVGSAFDVFLAAADDDPVIRSALLDASGESLLPLVTTQGQPLLERAAERLIAIIGARWPQVEPAAIELLAEALVRLAISHATLPGGPARLNGARVAMLLGPYIESAVATSLDQRLAS
jgi:AcrR family transcriptional regulator